MQGRPAYIRDVLPEELWHAHRQAHEDRLRPVLEPYLNHRSRGVKNPVMDFLFEYYAFRPSRLLRWSPGFGVALQGASAEIFITQPVFEHTSVGVALAASRFPDHRKKGIRWIREVRAATEKRPPMLGCHGLHEWAMVYETDAVRHPQLPLRMAPDALAAFVNASAIVCTHYDAFRFFTPSARPLNRHQPTHASMPALEQPGCLHTNMDLYRWAYKLYPWVPSHLLTDAFDLACRIREVDMRASPYDLRAFGLEAICIETPEGRRLYRDYQQRFAQEAAPLRTRLRSVYDAVIAHCCDDT